MKILIQRLALVLAVTFFSLASSCNEDTPTTPGISAEVEIDGSANGQQVTIINGQVLIVSLGSNPSTGFTWQVSEVDTGILQQLGIPRFQAGSSLLGAEGVQIFEFRTLRGGQTVLRMDYLRAFEENAEPTNTFSVNINVL
jgi:inhibitor of cysteine peptidase